MDSNSQNLPDYQTFTEKLLDQGLDVSASEVHGIVSGVLVLPDPGGIDWLDLILSTASDQPVEPDAELSRALLSIYQVTEHQLSGREFGFSLYLPDSNRDIDERTEALAGWCRGFLLGISASGLNADNSGDVVREILADIVELSGVEPEGDVSAEEEAALVEIEEYLRVAAQLLKEELVAVNSG